MENEERELTAVPFPSTFGLALNFSKEPKDEMSVTLESGKEVKYTEREVHADAVKSLFRTFAERLTDVVPERCTMDVDFKFCIEKVNREDEVDIETYKYYIKRINREATDGNSVD